MVDKKTQSGLRSMVKNQRHMTCMELLPLLNIWEILKFCQLNKASYHLLRKYVNFKVLFEAWGIRLTDAQVEHTKISLASAFKLALKLFMLKSIIESQQMIGKYSVLTNHVSLPDLKTFSNITLQSLRKLHITQVSWNDIFNIEFTLSNGQFCNAGTDFRYDQNHFFDFREKITRIEVIIKRNERSICQMNFYHHQQRLVAVGYPDDYVEERGGRVEVFEIGEDERLIGCRLGK